MSSILHLVSVCPSREQQWQQIKSAARPGDCLILLDAAARHVRGGHVLPALCAGVRICLPRQADGVDLCGIEAISADEWVELVDHAAATLSWN